MPVYEINSPVTGQSWKIDFQGAGTPTDADIEEAAKQFDNEWFTAQGVDPAGPVAAQTPAGTLGNRLLNIGPDALAAAGGIADLNATMGRSPLAGIFPLGAASEFTKGLTGFDALGFVADQTKRIQKEGELLRPVNPANETANTIGSAVNQVGAMIATGGAAAAAGMPVKTAAMVIPQAMGFGAGAGSGLDKARTMGIENPLGQAAMGMGYGGAEMLTEKIGGIGGDLLKPAGSLVGKLFQNSATETGEEILAGRAQDAMDVVAGQFVADPQRPGFTKTGFELPSLNPFDPRTLDKMKQEAIGGAAGGLIFSGIEPLMSRVGVGQPMSQTPAAPVDAIAAEDTGELTAADVAEFEPTPAPPPPAPAPRQAILQGMPDLAPRMRESSLNEEPLMEGDVITDLRVPRSPEAIAESQRAEKERQAQVSKLRMLDNQAKGVPMIADSPTGSRDILDWANENPIFLPPGFSEQRKLPEYEALSRNPLPPYWRQFVASGKQGGNPESIAQRAFDAGLIAEPTADAYMLALQDGIAGRQQYRVQFSQRDKALAQEEKRVVDFEKTQDKLAKKPQAQEVPFEDIVPGDAMTIDGEQAVVRNVEYNEDGYLTNVVIEDGKRFGLMQFDPQSRGGLLVDEYQPRGSTSSTPATGPARAPAATSGAVRGRASEIEASGGASPAMPPARREVNRVNEVNLADLNAELQMAGGLTNFRVDGTTAGFANAQILNEALDLVKQGFTTFANWSRAMVTRFGRGIQEFLAAIWQQITSPQTTAARNVRLGMPQGSAPVSVGQGGFVGGGQGQPIPEGQAETQSRFARPEQAARLYDVQGNEIMQQEAVAWLDANGVEAGLAAMEANQPPAGLRIDHLPALGETVIQRLMEATKQPGGASPAMPPARSQVNAVNDVNLEDLNAELQLAGGLTNFRVDGTTAGFANAQILNEALDLVAQGFNTFANWSKAMVTRFGRGIQEFLASIWRMVDPQTNAARNVRLGMPQGSAPVSVGQGGFVGGGQGQPIPEGQAETQSRFARPEQADRLYDVQGNEIMQQEAVAWLDANGVEAGLAAMEANQPPAGLRFDHLPALGETVIQRLMEATKQPGEAAQLMAEGLLDRAGIAWQGAMSQEAGRTLQQRAAANARLLPIAPVLAAKRILVDRADRVMKERFEGGAEGAVEKVKAIDAKASTEASEELTAQLEGEPEAPELGDNPEVEPVSDARVAELEQQMLAMREQMVRAETQAEGTLAQTTSTWQKIMGVLQGASSRKSALLTGAKGRLAALRKSAQARKAARRAEGRLSANPVEDFADDALIGASILAEGLVEFTNWSQALLREIGYRSGQDLRKLYAEASKKYLEALEAEKAAPTKTKGTPKQRAAREKINKAQRTAQNILDSLARRYSDPPIFDEGQRKINAMRELYKERVRTGMAEAEFVAKAKALGANEGTAGILWEASKLEIDAREMMALEKSRAGLAAYLQKDSPALAKMLDALRKKIAPGMTWAEIFMTLPSEQKARQKEIYRRLMKDERLKALNQGERLQLTNELDRAWQRERRKVFKRELQKAGVLGEKDASDRQKVVNGLPKLLRMINLGMFSSAVWREAVAPEYGLRMLTAADTAQLRTLAENAWKLPEGVLRNQKLRDLLNGIQKKTGASWVEVLNSYWTAAVLSGLRTQFDTWLSAVNGMGTNLMQIGGLLARGQGKAAIDAHAAWWRGLIEGVRESGQILWRGDTSYLKRFGADLQKALEGETSVTPVPLGENLWKNGNTFQKYGLAPVMMFTGRLMAAADHVNNTATTQGAIAVARALNPELYAGRVGFTDAERANARAQALREVTGGREPKTGEERATISARARELLNGLVKPADYAAASEIGDMAAFQNDPTGLFGVLYGAMKQGLGSIQRGLGEVAADVTANRFARVAAGLMAGSLHGITGTRFMRFGFNFGAELTRYLPGSYVLGKAGFYGRDVSRMQQELLLGKNMVGLMLGSTLAALFLSGDDEEEGWQIEGDWSTLNPQEARERMTAGLERMTLWKRDANGKVQRVSYKQWPTMGLFSVVGGMLDEKRYKPAQWAQHGTAGHLLRGLATGYVQVKNVSAVRNLVDIFGEPSFSSDAVTGAMDKMVKTSTNFAGGLVPTLVKDADLWSDPRNFKPEGVAEQMLRSVPIARRFVNDGRPQLNVLGEEVKLQRSPWSRAYTSVESGEAHRVLGALMARGLSLPLPSDQVHVIQNGVKVPLETLGREAVWKYEKAVGTAYKDWLSLEGSDLLALPTATAAKVIERRATSIKARARAQVVR